MADNHRRNPPPPPLNPPPTKVTIVGKNEIYLWESLIGPFLVPPPPCTSYALVQATVGVGTVIILYVIELRTKCSVAT